MKFVLIRHCLTDWNEQGRWQGRTDIPLNNTGRSQARDFALILKERSISHIVSSPLQRAFETASIIGSHLFLPVTIEEELVECSFGKLEGLTKEQMTAALGHTAPGDQDPYDFRPHAGEDHVSVRDRHLSALKKISSLATGPVLIVGHGRGLNTLLAHFGARKINRERIRLSSCITHKKVASSQPMPIRIHILSEDPLLRPWRSALLDIARTTVKKVSKRIALKNVDIVFSHNPEGAVAEVGGVGGYTPDAHQVLISLDPKHPHFKKNLLWSVSGTLAHELHHAARWSHPGYGTTLGEACITEGLADHFISEIFPEHQPFPWTQALKGAALTRMQRRAQKALHQSYDHNAWFFGSKQLRIPKWAGYAIGFMAVQEYLKQHPKTLPSILVHKKAEHIRKVGNGRLWQTA